MVYDVLFLALCQVLGHDVFETCKNTWLRAIFIFFFTKNLVPLIFYKKQLSFYHIKKFSANNLKLSQKITF